MDDFKKLTEQLLKVYINAESVDNFGIENYFDENISLIGTGKHELFTNSWRVILPIEPKEKMRK